MEVLLKLFLQASATENYSAERMNFRIELLLTKNISRDFERTEVIPAINELKHFNEGQLSMH